MGNKITREKIVSEEITEHYITDTITVKLTDRGKEIFNNFVKGAGFDQEYLDRTYKHYYDPVTDVYNMRLVQFIAIFGAEVFKDVSKPIVVDNKFKIITEKRNGN